MGHLETWRGDGAGPYSASMALLFLILYGLLCLCSPLSSAAPLSGAQLSSWSPPTSRTHPLPRSFCLHHPEGGLSCRWFPHPFAGTFASFPSARLVSPRVWGHLRVVPSGPPASFCHLGEGTGSLPHTSVCVQELCERAGGRKP